MKAKEIDKYNYCNMKDKKKDEFYMKHILTKEEEIKTEKFMRKLEDFIIKTEGKDSIIPFNKTAKNKIQYRDGLGYITIDNPDRDEVYIYSYGKTIEEAFSNALIDYEFYICQKYEVNNRQKLNKQFSERFLNGNYSEDDYYGPFFFAELALQQFRKYYGDNIPEEIIEYYENYLKSIYSIDYKYDYKTNSLVKNSKAKKK